MKRTVYLILLAIALLTALGFAFWFLGGAIMQGRGDKPAQEQSQLQTNQDPAGETASGEKEEETEPTDYMDEDAPVITFPEEEPIISEPPVQETLPVESGEKQEPTVPDNEPETTEAPEETVPSATFAGSGDPNELPPVPFDLG